MVNAVPMNRLDYNTFRGWTLPSDENGADEGYLVEYIDGGESNTEEYSGYVSWSPADVFKRVYTETSGLTFGEAIEAMKQGSKVARKGWNGKGMYIQLITTSGKPEYDGYPIQTCIAMKTADDKMQPGWLASQSDMLSTDYLIIN